MSEEIIKVLDALAEKFGLAVDWTSANVIPYLEQLCGKYVNYEIATSVVWLILGVISLFVGKWGIKMTKYCYNRYQEISKMNDWDVAAIFVGIITGVIIIVSVIVIICQVFDITTCLTFPEKIIIDELKSIYTSMK